MSWRSFHDYWIVLYIRICGNLGPCVKSSPASRRTLELNWSPSTGPIRIRPISVLRASFLIHEVSSRPCTVAGCGQCANTLGLVRLLKRIGDSNTSWRKARPAYPQHSTCPPNSAWAATLRAMRPLQGDNHALNTAARGVHLVCASGSSEKVFA